MALVRSFTLFLSVQLMVNTRRVHKFTCVKPINLVRIREDVLTCGQSTRSIHLIENDKRYSDSVQCHANNVPS